MDIKMVLKSRTYIFYLDGVKLSLGIHSKLFNGEHYTSFQDLALFFAKSKHQKVTNLALRLILAVGIKVRWSVE